LPNLGQRSMKTSGNRNPGRPVASMSAADFVADKLIYS